MKNSNNKRPAASVVDGVRRQPSSVYNNGNDVIENINRFSFPAISFSPSFPMLSPALSIPSPGSASLLSPRSPLAGYSASKGGSAALSPLSPSGSSPGRRSAQSGESGEAGSPLPPLSPRGQRLANAERLHNKICFNRIVEKRRKASDGTQDIVIIETTPMGNENVPDSWVSKFGHSRKVSFKLSAQEPRHLLGISLPSSLRSTTGATAGSSPSPSKVSLSPDGSVHKDGASSVPASFRLSSSSFGSDVGNRSPFSFTFSGPGDELRCNESVPSSPLIQVG